MDEWILVRVKKDVISEENIDALSDYLGCSENEIQYLGEEEHYIDFIKDAVRDAVKNF